MTTPDLAVFVATSGHSGVDTVVRNLLPVFGEWGLSTDVLKIRNHGPYLDELPRGSRLVELPSRHVETTLPALVRYLRQTRPGVLLTDKDAVNRLAIVARGIARVPTRHVIRLGTTVSVNLAQKTAWQAALQRASMRWLYRHADACVVPSRGAADDLANVVGANASAVHVLPNPVVHSGLYESARELPPKDWLPADRDYPVVVAAGSLTERKDYATLLRGFARLRRRVVCRLIIIGHGRCREALEQQAWALGVGEDVVFTGYLSNPYPYIASADVFAHTSRWEGLGVVLIEALALGTPVVATDCPSGPAEILGREGRLGSLVPVGDDEALADALEYVLATQWDREALGEGVAPFDTRASAQAYAQVLGLVAHERGPVQG